MPFDIPELKPEPVMDLPPQPAHPVRLWGSVSRQASTGTWAFYVDDYRFAGLFDGRGTEPVSPHIVEANYSILDQTPRAVAIHDIYRKRKLSQGWQQEGRSVWVDLCVAHKISDIALAGIPKGWQRYATAGFDARLRDLAVELGWARKHANGNPFTMLVFSGGSLTQSWCARNKETIHIPRLARTRTGEATRINQMKEAFGG